MTSFATSFADESIHFITGKLAESAVRETIEQLAKQLGFQYTVQVLPITVAALMTPTWLLRHLSIPENATRVILPGHLEMGIDEIRAATQRVIECGPKDIRDLPTHFGKKRVLESDFGKRSIDIIAEINYASRLSHDELINTAKQLVKDGADIIDLGCEPGVRWTGVAEAVKRLRDQQIRLSIDTFDPWEAAEATAAGAELVLSVNHTACEAAADWGAEVVVVPDMSDMSRYLQSIETSIELLGKENVPFRIDPILEPIGCGFAESLQRYRQVRLHFPDAPMMMGIGNITELTDCDSAGVNMLLLAICEEWNIHSVLTTQVISWAQSCVRECDIARKIVAYSVRHKTPPKKIDQRLVMLRDPKVYHYSQAALEQLAATIKDNNYRILVDREQIHLIAAQVFISGTDPFEMMSRLLELPESRNVDVSHAFYLGFELAKAMTALTLGKQYDQDVALRWGMLTRDEKRHRLPRKRTTKKNNAELEVAPEKAPDNAPNNPTDNVSEKVIGE
jgi:dihydropteroate synthase